MEQLFQKRRQRFIVNDLDLGLSKLIVFACARPDKLDVPVPVDSKCCDNCDPGSFQELAIVVTAPKGPKAGRPRKRLTDAAAARVNKAIINWRDATFDEYFSELGFSFTPEYILADEHVAILASSSKPLETTQDIADRIRWQHLNSYGPSLLKHLKIIYSEVDFTAEMKTARRERGPGRASAAQAKEAPSALPVPRLTIRIPARRERMTMKDD
jgi:hypothetical protein